MYLDAFDRRVNAPEGFKKKAFLDVEDIEHSTQHSIAANGMIENDSNNIILSSRKPSVDKDNRLILVGNQSMRDYFSQVTSQTQLIPEISVDLQTSLNSTARMRLT